MRRSMPSQAVLTVSTFDDDEASARRQVPAPFPERKRTRLQAGKWQCQAARSGENQGITGVEFDGSKRQLPRALLARRRPLPNRRVSLSVASQLNEYVARAAFVAILLLDRKAATSTPVAPPVALVQVCS